MSDEKSLSDAYSPQAGDIIWTDFDPILGREQRGRRPALVISPGELWAKTRLLLICPITSRIRGWSSSVRLPSELTIQGEVLTSHVRSIDTLARRIIFAERATDHVLDDARAKLAALLGIVI